MAVPDLAALVAHYQQALRLLDWRIDVSYARDLTDSAGRPAWGLCKAIADGKMAKIVIRDPATPPDGISPEEAARHVTETVVHELMHLHFAPFGNRTPAAIVAEEQAVWALAEALVNAKGTPDEPAMARAVMFQVGVAHSRLVGNQDPPRAAAAGDSAMTLDEFLAAAKALGFDGSASIDEVQAKLKGDPEKKDEPAPEEAPPAAAAVVPEEEKPAEAMAAVARLVAITGKSDVGESVREAERWRAVAIDLERREAKLAQEQAILDGVEIRRTVGELVKRGAIGVPLAWSDDKGTVPAPEWVALGVVGLRAMLAKVPAAAKNPALRAPASASDGESLSDRERAMCAEMKIDPKDYAARKPANAKKAS
jgi:hypothetical protein